MVGKWGAFRLVPALLSVFVLPLSILSSCRDSIDFPDNPIPGAEHDTLECLTIVYIAAENSLSDYALKDLNEMQSAVADIPDDCGLVAFVDDVCMPRIVRFRASAGMVVCDTLHVFSEDFCSSDTLGMRSVFDRIWSLQPARNMNIVLWSHGSGWIRSAKTQRNRSIGIDNGNNGFSNNSTSVIEIDELAAFMETLPLKPRLIMFDACFMQCVEVAYALRNSAEWLLASPAEIPGNGAPYHLMMKHFFARDFDIETLLNAYYAAYENSRYGVVLSAVRCSAMQQLADCTARFVPTLFRRGYSVTHDSVLAYLPGGYFKSGYCYPDYFDALDVMNRMLDAEAFGQWSEAYDSAVLCKAASPSYYSAIHMRTYAVDSARFGGMSMYLPSEAAEYSVFNRDFSETEWYSAAAWAEAGW